MKTVINKKLNCRELYPETATEAIQELWGFFQADMWYAKHTEWKTEEDMQKYLNQHFEICVNHIKEIEEKKERMTIHIVSGAKYEAGGSGHRPAYLSRAFRRLGYKVKYYYLIECMTMKPTKDDLIIVEFPYDKFVKHYDVLTNGAKVIYEVLDDWVALRSGIYDPEVEKELIFQADILTAVSNKLSGTYNAKYSPNAVDLSLFSQKNPKKKIKSDKFIIGYVGFMKGWWFDWDLIEELAKLRDVEIHLVGASNRISKLKNIFIHDQVDYENMPEYISSFDVCIIPFKEGDLYDATSPLKLYEYIACGKPVVAIDSKEKVIVQGVYFESTIENFITRVGMFRDDKKAGRLSSFDNQEMNKEFLEKNSWEARAKELLRFIEE